MRPLTLCCLLLAAAATGSFGEAEAEVEEVETSTYELVGTGHVLDYPAGWTATREVMRDSGRLVSVVTVITELPEDQDYSRPPRGYRLIFDHLRLSQFVHAIRPEAQYQSLLEFYVQFYGWPAPVEAELIELFDRPAVRMKARNEDDSWEYAAVGVGVFRELHRIGYAIQFTVPASKATGEAGLIWAGILASVRRAETAAAGAAADAAPGGAGGAAGAAGGAAE